MKTKAFFLVFSAIGLSGNASPCDEFTVVSDDARYMVLSAEDLSVTDVGNLWWMGVHTVNDIVPGSTATRLGVWSDSTPMGQNDLAKPPSLPQSKVYMLLADGERLQSSDVVITPDSDEYSMVWWDDRESPRQLFAFSSDSSRYSLSMLGSAGQEEWRIETAYPGIGMGSSCTNDRQERIVFGPKSAFRIQGTSLERLDLATELVNRGFRFTKVKTDCRVLLISTESQDIDENNMQASSVDLAVYDVNADEVSAIYRRGRFVKRALIDGGKLMLEQLLEAEEDSTGGFRIKPTRQLQVLDIEKNEIISRLTLDRGGSLSSIRCNASTGERAIVYSQNRISLISLPNLTVLSSVQIPFTRFFVF